jgi:hypothetical protein
MTKGHPAMAQGADALRERAAAAQKCFERLCPAAERQRRAAVAREMVQNLSDYRAYLAELQPDGPCDGLRRQLGDRAFEAEEHLRILLAEGLKCVNDLRDSGWLYAGMTEFANWAHGRQDLAAIVRAAERRRPEEGDDLPPGLLHEFAGQLERRKPVFAYDRDAGLLSVTSTSSIDGNSAVSRVRLAPQAGDLGRVGVGQFFSASGRGGIYAREPVFVPSDCHHLQTRPAIDETVDLYASLVASLALARESMYRHARKVAEFGHGGATVRAQDPVAAIVVGAVISAIGWTIELAAGLGHLDPLGFGSPTLDVWFGAALAIEGVLIVFIAIMILFY